MLAGSGMGPSTADAADPYTTTRGMQSGVVQSGVVQSGTTYQTQTANKQTPSRQLNWAESMFSQLEHDFGNVAAGADVTHQITIENPYEETVRVVKVDKTCGCTEAKISQSEIGTHESVTVDIGMDTRKFRNEKRSNVLITLAFTKNGQTAQEEVRVPIRAFIRQDVVIEPGGANFGNIEKGQPGEKLLTILDHVDLRIEASEPRGRDRRWRDHPGRDRRIDVTCRTGRRGVQIAAR